MINNRNQINEQLRRELGNAYSQLNILRQNANSLLNEINQLTDDLKKNKELLEKSDTEKEKISQELEKQKELLSKSNKQIPKIKEILNNEIRRLKENHHKKIHELEKNLEETQTRMGNKIKQYEGEKDRLRNELGHWQSELNKQIHYRVSQQKEIDKLTTYLKNSGLISGELTSGIVCLDTVVKNMANELAKVKTANLELQNNLAEKTGTNATQLTQITNLQKELEQLETTSQLYYQTNEAEKQQLCQQVSHEQQKITARERDIEQLEREKSELDNLIKVKEEELKALQEQLRLTDLNNLRQIINLNSQINTRQTKIERLKEEKEQIKLKLLELTGNFNKERIITHSYRKQRDQERKRTKTDQTNFINQIRELKAINQQKQERIEELENDQNIKDQVLNSQEQTINTLRENLNNSANEIIIHCERVEELDNLLNNKTNQLAQVNSELAEANNQIANLENQLNELESVAESYYQTNSKHNNKQTKKLAKLKAKLTQARANKQHNILRINGLNNRINNPPLHTCSPCPLIHLPAPHNCPIINQVDCSHTDYDTIKQERDQYQQELTNQAHEFIQKLNTTFDLNLAESDINLDKVIERLKELINKPPLTLTDENIQAELVRSQELIVKLEKELAEKNLGEPIENIIQIDEKLLHENETLKVNLNKQVNNYQELAEERNKLVFQEIKNINVEKLREVLPQVSREVIEKHLASAQNYTELASARNNLLVESIKSSKQEVPTVVYQPKSERVIWLSLLLVSLISISGLLVKVSRNKHKRVS